MYHFFALLVQHPTSTTGTGETLDLRSLLECLRFVRRTAVQTTVRVVTTGILLALILGLAIKLKLFGSGP